MNPGHTNAIIVFLRFPVKGKVKTRLASQIGNELSCSFYRICTEYIFTELLKLKDGGCDIYLFVSDKGDIEKIIKWTENSFYYSYQKGFDLGERMLNAFTDIFHKNHNQVIIVGTDLPGITARLIKDAFSFLNDYDCVIGPANDGGYYLLGFREKVIDIFSGIAWSTESVLKETTYMLKKHKATFYQMEEIIDIDTKEDLFRWYYENELLEQHPVKIFIDNHKSEL